MDNQAKLDPLSIVILILIVLLAVWFITMLVKGGA